MLSSMYLQRMASTGLYDVIAVWLLTSFASRLFSSGVPIVTTRDVTIRHIASHVMASRLHDSDFVMRLYNRRHEGHVRVEKSNPLHPLPPPQQQQQQQHELAMIGGNECDETCKYEYRTTTRNKNAHKL